MGTASVRGTYEEVPSVDNNMADDEESDPRRNVRFEEVDGDDSLNSFDDEMPRRRRMRRHRVPPSGSSMLQNAWVCAFCLMLLIGGALIGWKENLYESHQVVPLDDSSSDGGYVPWEQEKAEQEGMKNPLASNTGSVHYDPSAGLHSYNPFDLQEPDWYGSVLVPPPVHFADEEEGEEGLPLGYMRQPNVVNGTLVFVSEGDLYLTKLDPSSESKALPAMKLTTTVGNVLSPKINPVYPYWIAYTATYTGRREVYLYDLRPSHRHTPALRLTYWDSSAGVSHVVGWKDDGKTLVFSAPTNEVGLSDIRLYQMGLAQEGTDDRRRQLHHLGSVRVLQIVPVPLSQAIDGVYGSANDCLYFTRFQQSSNTIRYVGGTVESLWAHCHNQDLAVPLTTDYKGTDKSPQIMTLDGTDFLLFLSDRNENNIPTSMSLWAMPLPSQKDLYSKKNVPAVEKPVRLTQVSCEFNGMSLMEYSLDAVTNNVVLRIGADLHLLSVDNIRDVLTRRRLAENTDENNGKDAEEAQDEDEKTEEKDSKKADKKETKAQASAIQRLPVVVYSDFHEHQERILPVTVPKDMTSVDIYGTTYGQTSVLLNIRGQVFVTPVIPDVETFKPFEGAGMNMPLRKYLVAPGSTTGGMLRVLTALHVPMWQEADKSTRRLAVLLATDPLSETAEHAFYLVETQSDSAPSFVDVADAPDPFLGGHINGGSVANGGLGSVKPDKVVVSPCGRRLAWTDTDGRICVMTLPLYQNSTSNSGPSKYVVLPQENERGEPMVGDEVDLSWSPGGTYLAVTHSARNQFDVITIVDCGNPERDGPLEVADIEIGRIVQATPDRFNSFSVYWGHTALDISTKSLAAMRSKLLGEEMDYSGATTLYFLSDRDVVTDVSSPWGTRAPSPHFPNKFSVFALPLLQEKEDDPSSGIFSGGGAAELWADGIIELQQQLQEMLKAVEEVEKDEDVKRRLLSEPVASFMADAKLKNRWMKEKATSPSSAKASSQPHTKTSSTPATKAAVTGSPTESPSAATPPPSKPPKKVVTGSPTESPTATESSEIPSSAPSSLSEVKSPFPSDKTIDFGPWGTSFARRAYRVANIPQGNYISIVCQLADDPSFVVLERTPDNKVAVRIFAAGDYPSDELKEISLQLKNPALELMAYGLSTTRQHFYLVYSGTMKVISNTAAGLLSMIQDEEFNKGLVDATQLSLSVWPSLEYHQMYSDAWRMLRDYFYDPHMTGLNWPEIHSRYIHLVRRCAKREELDDVLQQMAAELSALHVFVYGGEYGDPMHGDVLKKKLNEVASLGASLERSAEWKGYVVTSIPKQDPDFNKVDGNAIYSPLSGQMLGLSGQKGLEVGDVIVGVNGESVMRVPDIHMLLRGMAGRSVRLDVLRLSSNSTGQIDEREEADVEMVPEPIITVPITPAASLDLRYGAWEWKTRKHAKQLARDKGFSLGYVHLQSMSNEDEDAFVRGFYPDYDKQAFIVDVRHNRGGNIDSWLLDALQRKAWMYWQSRTKNITTGGLGWDEQMAFRGHLVVLIDEKTSSDGEGFSRGVSELGLGKLIGMRTWGGGIWLSSDNHLVDGGIATAPEVGTYNDNFGWGLGIEQMGVEPDIEVDNNPRESYDGKDRQLEHAIDFLAQWLEEEPIAFPENPGPKRDMSLSEKENGCNAS